jgi:uncharacterized protein (DUF736 family)|tara:strand:+ start:26 stop:289 length:264 start_codon:yes stop_codon:yes gene_type:complete
MPKQEKPFDGGKYTYVFENKFKESDSQPDYSGSNLIVNGEEKDVAIWRGVSKKTGAEYLSLQIKDPYKKSDEADSGPKKSEKEELPF